MQGEPFVVGAIGNFSGQHQPKAIQERTASTRFLDIDRDNFDTVLARLAPRIQLDLPFCRTLRLSSWGDFHPDGLAERLPALQELLEARGSVGNPPLMRRHLERAGADFTRVLAEADGEPMPADSPKAAVSAMSDGQLLESMLGGSPDEKDIPRRRAESGGDLRADPVMSPLDRAIREIVATSGDGTDYTQQDRWREAIDAELSLRMVALLRHPEFRRLESSWGSLRDLVRHSDTGEGLRIRVLDLAQEHLLAELAEKPELEQSTLHRLVTESEPGLPGKRPFDLLVTDFHFDIDPESLRLLAYLFELCERAQVPLLAAATGRASDIRGASEQELQAWVELRKRPGARWIGLCTPEILLRLPYGPETEPIESFAFEEGAHAEACDEGYVWCSASFGVAGAVTQAYTQEGDLSQLARYTELDNLPMHVYRDGDEVQQRGPAREIFTEPRLEACQLMGLIPLVAPRGRDSLRIVSFRSLAGTDLFSDG